MRLTEVHKLEMLRRAEEWSDGAWASPRWDWLVQYVQDLIDGAVVRGAARERRYEEVRDAVVRTCASGHDGAGIHAVRSLLRTFGVHKAVYLNPSDYDEFTARLAKIREALGPR